MCILKEIIWYKLYIMNEMNVFYLKGCLNWFNCLIFFYFKRDILRERGGIDFYVVV